MDAPSASQLLVEGDLLMGFWNDLGSNIVRGTADFMTFGTNELLGNPAGKAYDALINPQDPNAGYNAQQYALAQQNMALQKEFAQNGITWRVADAARNGISPLAALGGSEPSYSPVSMAFAPAQPSVGQDLLRSGAVEMGQGLGRALLSTQSPMVQAEAKADLAWKTKQNDLLDVQIANAKLELARNAAKPVIQDAFRAMRNRDGSISYYPVEGLNTYGSFGGPSEWSLRNKLLPTAQDFVGSKFGNIAPPPPPRRGQEYLPVNYRR